MKLQINKKVNGPKSATFAVIDSLNYYIAPSSLKEMNVPKLADKIVTETRREFGEAFTKANLEFVLDQTVKNMTTTTAKPTANKATKSSTSTPAKKEVTLSEQDLKVVNSVDANGEPVSLNKRVAELSHLWDHPSVLAKAFGKSRQRIINAIGLAKEKRAK